MGRRVVVYETDPRWVGLYREIQRDPEVPKGMVTIVEGLPGGSNLDVLAADTAPEMVVFGQPEVLIEDATLGVILPRLKKITLLSPSYQTVNTLVQMPVLSQCPHRNIMMKSERYVGTYFRLFCVRLARVDRLIRRVTV